jgi:hypothetical protein
MAISVPRKTRKQKARAAIRRKGKVATVDWTDADKLSGAEYHKKRRVATDEIYNEVKASDLHAFIYTYMKKEGYSAKDIKCAKASPTVSTTAGIYAKLLLDGMPDYHEAQAEYWASLPGTSGELRPVSDFVKREIGEAIKRGKPRVAEKEREEKLKAMAEGKAYKPTIQQIMHETSINMSEGLEEVVEEFITTQDPAVVKKFDAYRVLVAAEAKANHARIIKGFYEGCYEELYEVNNLPTSAQRKKLSETEQDLISQLEEGYSHYSTAQKKAALELYKKIIDACDMIITSQKATRKPRKVKEKSADQIVAKLKLKQADTDYGIASVAPSGLIGAVCALVFNTKNRKLGMYVATDADGFTVKGTTLQRYDEAQSIQKTLRKPNEILPKVKKTTKAKAIKEFGFLKTTETKLNGRFNEETVLLAVFK